MNDNWMEYQAPERKYYANACDAMTQRIASYFEIHGLNAPRVVKCAYREIGTWHCAIRIFVADSNALNDIVARQLAQEAVDILRLPGAQWDIEIVDESLIECEAAA